MKKISNFISFLFLMTVAAFSQQSKMDPLLSGYLLSPANREAAEKRGLLKQSEEGPMLPTIITWRGALERLKEVGVRIRWHRGELIIAELPLQRLPEIAALPEVVFIQADRRAKLTNDIAVKEIGALQARQTTGLTGKGVLIGIIDSGIDFRHQDFRKADGSTRIKSILDLSEPGAYYGGKVYTEAEINATLKGIGHVEQSDQRGHGSHVAGIAAGDGSATAAYGSYAGVAPEADLVIVKAIRGGESIELLESDQLIGIGFIDSVAQALGKAYVANLSFGADFGAHDGTSAVERYIDALSGNGKVFVTSAGNRGADKIHAAETVTGTTKEITFKVEPYVPQPMSGNDRIALDGWYNGTGQITITLISPQNNSFGPVNDGHYREWDTAEGHILILNGFYPNGAYYQAGINPFNNDKEILILISDEGTSNPPAQGTWTLRLSGRANPIDFWLAEADMDVMFSKGISLDMTLTMPGTAKKVLTVGAYTSRESWRDLDGNNLTIDTQGTIRIGDIADFSGAGPTRDHRIKPEITAPGQIIASSYSADAPASSPASIFLSPSPEYPNAFVMPDSLHALSLGTSMAAPYVSGVCALLLEKYPDVDVVKIRQLLQVTAKRPSFAGNANKWGYGKLDAYQAAIVDIHALPDSVDSAKTTQYILSKATPNPCSSGIVIQYLIPSNSDLPPIASLKVFDCLGRFLRRIEQTPSPLIENRIFWDCRDRNGRLVANGVYFLEFRAGDYKEIQKITVLHEPQ